MNCLIFLCTNHKPKTKQLANLPLYTSLHSLVMDFTYRLPKMLSRVEEVKALPLPNLLHPPHSHHQQPLKKLPAPSLHLQSHLRDQTLRQLCRHKLMLQLFR